MVACDVGLPCLVLIIHMPSDAAGSSARKRMMSGVVASDPANQRAANASLGIDRCGGRERCWNRER